MHCFTYRRNNCPPTQRMPAPNVVPPGIRLSPCRKMHVEPEYMPVPFSTTDPGSVESAARLAFPPIARFAPELPVFAQPSPAPFAFPHTQAITPAWVGSQNGVEDVLLSEPSSVQPVRLPVSCAAQSTMFNVHVPDGPEMDVIAVLLIT